MVGIATLAAATDREVEVAVLVEDRWQRAGLGTRLLFSAARLARARGADDVVLRSRSHHPALMSLAFACGLRARVRLDPDAVVVTVAVDGLKPLTVAPAVTSALPAPALPAQSAQPAQSALPAPAALPVPPA